MNNINKAISWWKSLSIPAQKYEANKVQSTHTNISLKCIDILYQKYEEEILLSKALDWFSKLSNKDKIVLMNISHPLIQGESEQVIDFNKRITLYLYNKAIEIKTWNKVINLI